MRRSAESHDHDGETKKGAEREAFERLLTILDADRERAAEAYETLRLRLARFFEWRGAEAPQDLADCVVDRVSRKIAEGEVIREPNLAGFFYGVAQNILREHWDERKKERRALGALSRAGTPDPPDALLERRLRCLERCLETLSDGDRELIVRYYEGEGRSRIENRKHLADSRGVPLNTLRIRACRLREQIERRVMECVVAAHPP